jgi:hypothetical protein
LIEAMRHGDNDAYWTDMDGIANALQRLEDLAGGAHDPTVGCFPEQ